MHPLTCYAGQISLCHAKIEKISKKIFSYDRQRWGGGQFLDFMGRGHSCYEGGHRAHGGPPLGKTLGRGDRENRTPTADFESPVLLKAYRKVVKISVSRPLCTSIEPRIPNSIDKLDVRMKQF